MKSIKEELTELKVKKAELERKIKRLEGKLKYKTADGILAKINRLWTSVSQANLAPLSIKISDDVNRVLENEFVWSKRANCEKFCCSGQSYIMGLPVKVDRTVTEYISIEVGLNE